jgi:predicted TIM-barrel fold metal-dependent hydrolase
MAAMDPAGGEIIDLHVHLFPERMFVAVWEYFESRGWGVHREQVEQIARTLRSHGLRLAVGLSYPHKPGVAGPLNRFMEEVGRADTLFWPFASVHPDDDDFEAVVEHALASEHLHGFKFQPLVQRFDVNHPRLDHLYRACLERDLPITMHIGSGPVANEFVGPAHLTRLLGRFPDLRICVPHMGAPEFDAFLALLDDHPNLFLDTTMIQTRCDLFDTRFRGDPDRLARHAERICFGSDWPNVPYPYAEALASVERFGFSSEMLPGVLATNARRFLRLPAARPLSAPTG